MEYSTPEGEKGMDANGVEYDVDSIYAQLGKLTDTRKARGKRYSLKMIMTVIILAKICGQNTIVDIPDWAENNLDELVSFWCETKGL